MLMHFFAVLFFLNRLIEGLSAGHLLDDIRGNPGEFKKVFCASDLQLTAMDIEQLFQFDFSECNTSQYLTEIRILEYWNCLIKEIQGNCSV